MTSNASTSTWNPEPPPGPPPSQIPSASEKNVLDFDMAMTQFKSMFPNISATAIEKVLRAHNGDVTNTINDLLSHSADLSVATPQITSSARLRYAGEISLEDKDTQQHRSQTSQRESERNCVDDEKIALLMQNREFLEYLQYDARFMHEIGEYRLSSFRHLSHHRRYVPLNSISHCSTTVCTPPIIESTRDGTWRVCAPLAYYQYGNNYYPYNINTSDVTERRQTTRLYDMPPQKFEAEKKHPPALPDGPIVDYGGTFVPKDGHHASSSKNWSQRVKSHLPRIGINGTAAHDEHEQMIDAPFVDYSVSDDNFTNKLRNMSKYSKDRLLTLAKRFTHSRKFSHPNQMVRMTNSGEAGGERRHSLEHDFDEKQRL